MKGDRNSKTGENEIGCVIERVSNGLVISERAVQHNLKGIDGILAEHQDNKSGNRKRGQDIQSRDDPDIDPFRKLDRLTHAVLVSARRA